MVAQPTEKERSISKVAAALGRSLHRDEGDQRFRLPYPARGKDQAEGGTPK